jgi:hypothetical protein
MEVKVDGLVTSLMLQDGRHDSWVQCSCLRETSFARDRHEGTNHIRKLAGMYASFKRVFMKIIGYQIAVRGTLSLFSGLHSLLSPFRRAQLVVYFHEYIHTT